MARTYFGEQAPCFGYSKPKKPRNFNVAIAEPFEPYFLRGDLFYNGESQHWLARLCYWTLRKLGVESWRGSETTCYMRRLHVDDSLVDKIMQHSKAIRRLRLGQSELRLVIGANTFRTLQREVGRDYFEFEAEARFAENIRDPESILGYRRRDFFMGMRVEVVPWWEGYLVLPDDSR